MTNLPSITADASLGPACQNYITISSPRTSSNVLKPQIDKGDLSNTTIDERTSSNALKPQIDKGDLSHTTTDGLNAEITPAMNKVIRRSAKVFTNFYCVHGKMLNGQLWIKWGDTNRTEKQNVERYLITKESIGSLIYFGENQLENISAGKTLERATKKVLEDQIPKERKEMMKVTPPQLMAIQLAALNLPEENDVKEYENNLVNQLKIAEEIYEKESQMYEQKLEQDLEVLEED